MKAEKKKAKRTDTGSAAEAAVVQCSLAIGAVNDPLEHEADAMADKVMGMQETPAVSTGSAGGTLQRCGCGEEEKVQRKPLASFIQRKEATAGTIAPGTVTNTINANKGRGSSMDSTTQSFMQSRFGADFSEVKIHTGEESIQMNRELNAKAFTVGNDIYFNEGQYNPNSGDGKHLLAHELTHTIQQGGEGSLVQRVVTETKGQDDKAPQEKDICDGWESDLESLTIDAARFHFRTEHGETIQVQTLDCVSATSVKIKVCILTLSDGRVVRVMYSPERNIIRVQHEVSGVLKFCRYSYTCSYTGSVTYTKLDCNE